jgi:NAD(P)H-dependent FMN reductase
MNILGLSGSLRAGSINSTLLRAAGGIAPSDIKVSIFQRLGLYRAVVEADALLIASPEYAHGVSGTIKNALDWLVGFEPFAGKCVAVLNASPRAHHADDALRETLRTMATVIVEPASISIPLLGTGLDEAAIVNTPALATAILGALRALQRCVASRRDPSAAE